MAQKSVSACPSSQLPTALAVLLAGRRGPSMFGEDFGANDRFPSCRPVSVTVPVLVPAVPRKSESLSGPADCRSAWKDSLQQDVAFVEVETACHRRESSCRIGT